MKCRTNDERTSDVLIILEGVDGSGKTTMARRLADLTVDPVLLHRGPPQSDDMYEEYLHPLQKYQPGSGKTIICDRWHVGELVYGPKYRESKLDQAHLTTIERELYAKGALLIYMRPPLKVIKKRLQERGDDYIKEGDHVHLYQLYEEIMPRSIVTVTVPTESPSDSDVSTLRSIARYLEFNAVEKGLRR